MSIEKQVIVRQRETKKRHTKCSQNQKNNGNKKSPTAKHLEPFNATLDQSSQKNIFEDDNSTSDKSQRSNIGISKKSNNAT